MKTRLLILTAAGSFTLGWLTVPHALPQQPVRFDHVVRNDFFAGFGGDAEAFQRGMKKTEEVLAQQPNHAEALVWHGAGVFSQSGQAFQAGDVQKGIELWTKGLAEMDRAVELAPDHVGVRIPRGAPLLTVSRFVPADRQKELLTRAMADYEHVFKLQSSAGYLEKMGTHPKGELYMGLADGYDRTGQKEKSAEMLKRVVAELPGSVYAKRAQKWMETGQLAPNERNCIGCHTAAQ